nr:NADH-ubiquinone oxidoreductase chain 2 [Ipomoea batatas]
MILIHPHSSPSMCPLNFLPSSRVCDTDACAIHSPRQRGTPLTLVVPQPEEADGLSYQPSSGRGHEAVTGKQAFDLVFLRCFNLRTSKSLLSSIGYTEEHSRKILDLVRLARKIKNNVNDLRNKCAILIESFSKSQSIDPLTWQDIAQRLALEGKETTAEVGATREDFQRLPGELQNPGESDVYASGFKGRGEASTLIGAVIFLSASAKHIGTELKRAFSPPFVVTRTSFSPLQKEKTKREREDDSRFCCSRQGDAGRQGLVTGSESRKQGSRTGRCGWDHLLFRDFQGELMLVGYFGLTLLHTPKKEGSYV